MDKILSTLTVFALILSTLTVLGVGYAKTVPIQGGNSQGTLPPPDKQPGTEDTQESTEDKGFDMNPAEKMKKGMKDIVGGIGQRIKEAVGEKVKQIKQAVKGKNVSGEEVSEIAKQIGVRAKSVVMTRVQQIQNQTQQRILQMKGEHQKVQEKVKMAKTGRYDYAYDKFTEKAEIMVQEAKQRGINVTGLNQTLENASKAYLDMYQSNDTEEAAARLEKIATRFHQKMVKRAKAQIGQIENAAEEKLKNQSSLEQVRNNTWNHVQGAALISYDKRIKAAENIVNTVKNNLNLNATQLENTLQKMKKKRTELKEAYEQKDNQKIKNTTQEIRQLWQKFRTTHRDLNRGKAMEKTQERVQQTLNKTQELIDKAKEKEVSAVEAQNIQQKMENGLKTAKQAMENKNFTKAQQEIKELKKRFQEYKQTMQNLGKRIKTQGGG